MSEDQACSYAGRAYNVPRFLPGRNFVTTHPAQDCATNQPGRTSKSTAQSRAERATDASARELTERGRFVLVIILLGGKFMLDRGLMRPLVPIGWQ